MILNFVVQPPHEALFSTRDLIIALVTLLTGLIGVCVGAWLNDKAEKRSTEAKNKYNAYTSAVLIRNWIREKIEYLNNLKKNLSDRLELIENGIVLERGDHIKLTQDLPDEQSLFELDFDLIKDLTLMRGMFREYEITLQKLSFCNSYYSEAKNIESRFHDMNNNLFKNKLKELSAQKNPQDMITHDDFFGPFEDFQEAFKRVAPDWIDIIDHHEKCLRQVFADFQETICIPLDVRKIELGETCSRDDLIFKK